MSFICSAALAAEFSGGNCSDIAASAQSSPNPTRSRSSSPDKTTALSRRSRSSPTYAPLTADRGAALLTSWLAGFPARTSSVAGKGAGIDGERSGLWGHMARIVGEVRPRFVFVENSPALLTRGLGRVLADLAALGYDCRWTVLGASDVGAPHQRDRFWLLAHADSESVRGEGHPGPLGTWGTLQGRTEQRERVWPDVATGGRVANVADANKFARHEGRSSHAAQEPGGRDTDRSSECSCAMADSDREGQLQPNGPQREIWRRACDCGAALRNANGAGLAQRQSERGDARQEQPATQRTDWWLTEPGMGGMVDWLAAWLDQHGADAAGDVARVAVGIPHRVGRLRAIGNGQVPLCAATAFRMLAAEFD